jgi:DNA adenine methylase (dam)
MIRYPRRLTNLLNSIKTKSDQNYLFNFDRVPPLKPIVKWSGGKSREIQNFYHHYPKKFKTYIEPFVGGGAVFFNLGFKKNVIADVHKGLINFYTQIALGNAIEIYRRVSLLELTEESYYYVRDKLELKDDIDWAVRFYYLRKTAFRGMLRYNKNGKFNIPWGRYKSVNFEELKNECYTELLKHTDVRLSSFENIFEEFNSPDNFVFLDPPYDSKFTDYGYCQFGEDYQRKLADIFKITNNKCLMIIGKTPLIDELYEGYIVDSYSKKYSFRLHSGRIGNEINTDHVIIKNYDLDK